MTINAPILAVVAAVALVIDTTPVAVTVTNLELPDTVKFLLMFASTPIVAVVPTDNVPLILAVVPTIKFLAIAAPPLTCKAVVCPVELVTVPVPCTIKPLLVTKSSVIAIAVAIFYSFN